MHCQQGEKANQLISKKLRGSTLRVILFSLIVGLLQGAILTQPVNSAANLVTITVNSSSSTPMLGASVAIGWFYPSPQGWDLRFSTIYTTNASGVAVVDIGANSLVDSALFVQPPATSDDAINSWDFVNSGTAGAPAMTVTLKRAQIFFSVYNETTAAATASSSNFAPIKTMINSAWDGTTGGDYEWLLRTGEVGFSTKKTITSGMQDRITVTPNVIDPANPKLDRTFNVTFGTTVSNSTVTDTFSGATITPVSLGNHVGYKVFFNQPNLRVRVTENDGTPLTQSGLSELRVLIPRSPTDCCDGYGASPGANGVVSLALPAGNYFLEAIPSDPRLVQTRFPVAVSVSGGVSTITFTPTRTKDGEIYSLPLDAANLTGVVRNKAGTAVGTDRRGSYLQVYANLFKLDPDDPRREDWKGSSEVDINGNYTFSVKEAGRYKIRVDIQGSSAYAPSESSVFEFSTDNLLVPQTQNVTLQPPTLVVKVSATSAAGSPLSRRSSLQVYKDDQFLSYWNTDDSGVSAVLFDAAGTYKLRLDPPWDGSLATSTTKTYTVVVTSTDGILSIGSITDQSGNAVTRPTSPSTQWALSLGTALFTGTVCTSSTGTCVPVSQSNVVAVDQVTDEALWQNSANTGDAGTWALSVPDGTYKIYARAPWNSSKYADSDLTGAFTVANGIITDGGSGSAIKLGLNQPYWSGTLKSPDGTQTIANGHLNLNLVVSGRQIHVDASSDADGKWAIGKPQGFVSFDEFSNFMVRQESASEFAPLSLQGSDAISAKLPIIGGANIDLRLASPNLTVTVTDPSSNPVSNVWVNVNNDLGWLGGSNTNSIGVAKFSLSDVAIRGKFQIQLQTGGRSDLAGIYAPTTTTITPAACSNPCSKTVAFATPNFKGWVKTPTGSENISRVWVDVLQDSTGQWVGGSETNSAGFFSLNLPSGTSVETYTVNTNAPWGTVSPYTRNTYKVGVNPGGNVRSVVSVATNSVIESTTVSGATGFPLTLASPSIKGYVKNASGQIIQNSQVTPIQITAGRENYLWQNSIGTGSTGAFALAMPDGTYMLEANPAWGSTAALAKSAKCEILVAAQSTSIVDGVRDDCSIDAGSITLNLRAPNATIHINSPAVPSAPVPNSHVGMQWMTDNGSNQQFIDSNVGSNGIANFFINSSAIDAFSKGTPANAVVNVWIDPPWGDTSMVRSQCRATYAEADATVNANICQKVMAFAKANTGTLDATVALQGPNTGIKVTLPNSETATVNAWVNVFKKVENTWLAGGNTDSLGLTKFNLPVPTNPADLYTVEVNAPWDKRDIYSTKTCELSFTQLQTMSQVCQLGSPNLILTVNARGDVGLNTYGWIGLEESNGDGSWTWIGGYGLDDTAKAAITLPRSSKTYRITAFPGGSVAGVRTTKEFTTDASGNVSSTQVKLSGPTATKSGTLTLSGGNVSGTVTKSGSGASAKGWVVYANVDVAGAISSTAATAITTSVGADGSYSLPLGVGTWHIKIIPTDAGTTGTVGAAFTISNPETPFSSAQTVFTY